METRTTEIQPRKPKTLRLTLHYEGDKVNLISQQVVDMICPPTDPLEYSEEEAGFWFMLRDRHEQILYRRIIQSPMQYAVEIRSNDPDRPLSWKTVNSPRGEFVLLLPALEEAATVSLFSSPFSLKEAMGPAREFATIPLERDQNKKEGS